MADYQKLYHLMVDAAERAIDALEHHDSETAKRILIAAEMNAEEAYIQWEEE